MDCSTIERIKNSIKDSSIGPETIALILTRVCNLRCLYCRGGRPACVQQQNLGSTEELSSQELLEMFLDAKKLGVKEINLGGMIGDPFCKENILWILAKIKELGFVGSMTTNGFSLNRKTAEFLTACNWDILHLSFDSSDSCIQHTLRPAINGESYFERVIEFLKTLDALQSKVRVMLNVVITKLNYRKFPELVSFANNCRNIESINVLKLLNTGLSNYDLLQLSAEELSEFRQMLLALKDEKKIQYLNDWIATNDPGVDYSGMPGVNELVSSDVSTSTCFTNYYVLSIDSNGDIIKCPQHSINISGLNIRSIPLIKLWKKEHLLFRESLVKHAGCFEGCCTILKEQNRLIYRNLY
jgi:MoaA/NifB/PqqE/SkfB family radical SAM enzyme